MGIRCADHVTPLSPQKLALTSPIGGGRSVGIVRSRTKATEFFYLFLTFGLFPLKLEIEWLLVLHSKCLHTLEREAEIGPIILLLNSTI